MKSISISAVRGAPVSTIPIPNAHLRRQTSKVHICPHVEMDVKVRSDVEMLATRPSVFGVVNTRLP